MNIDGRFSGSHLESVDAWKALPSQEFLERVLLEEVRNAAKGLMCAVPPTDTLAATCRLLEKGNFPLVILPKFHKGFCFP